MLSIDPYDGSTNPIDQLERFKALMHLQDAFDALLSLAFSVTLKKAARMLFSSLPLGSVHLFQQLDH